MRNMLFPLSGEILSKIKEKITTKEIKLIKDYFFPLETIEEYIDNKTPYSNLISWLGRLNKPEYFDLCKRVFSIIDDYIKLCDPYLLYAYYEYRLEIYWKIKDIENAKIYAKKLIDISNSVKNISSIISHENKGYKRMIAILTKEKDFEGIINICEKAKSEKWKGEWDKNIENINNKFEKGNKE